VRVLAIDTTTVRASVALVTDGELDAEARVRSTDGHSRWLMEAVRFVLDVRGLKAAAVDLFAVTLGPGSFTGVRVGLSTVQGLALATGRPCAGVCSLDVVASLGAAKGQTVVALVDAFRDEVFAGVYADDGRRLQMAVGPIASLLSEISDRATFVGDGVSRYRQVILDARPGARLLGADLFLAAPLARLAVERLGAGGGISAEELRPLYLRGAGVRVSPPA
jgi:tRNA threonylcarbamoyladenosine biosynthesis protein TsaB